MAFYRYLVVPLAGENVMVVDGMHLLMVLQTISNKLPVGTAPAKDGSGANPWLLKTADDWFGCMHKNHGFKKKVKEAKQIHFNFAGRLIRGNTDYYFGDAGPVWRKGVDPTVDTREGKFHNSVGAVTSEAALATWKKLQHNPDPTYQKLAQRVVDPGSVFQVDPEFNYSDAPWRKSWADVSFNTRLTDAVRKIMCHEHIDHGGANGKFDKHYSQLQHLLPCLVGAMFVAEPARNPRAWPINLMLLDLAGAGQPVLMHDAPITWDKILWHPQALEISMARPENANEPIVGDALEGPKGGFLPEKEGDKNPIKDRSIVPITTLGKLHLIGGIMPASPTDGGWGARQPLEDGLFDYIHSKEVEVLLTWLVRKIPGAQRIPASPALPGKVARLDAVRTPKSVQGQPRERLEHITKLMTDRARSIAAM